MTRYTLEGTGPEMGPEVWVAPDAAVLGNVRLEGGTSVWFGAVIRGDGEKISVGTLSNIQDLSVLHTDTGFPLTVGPGCTIGHRAILHGCTIGANTLVGMGAIILNGAQIGRDCLIGAGALVTEGKVIPDGMLVLGTPARVTRMLTTAEIAANTRSASHYAENAARFRAGLMALPGQGE